MENFIFCDVLDVLIRILRIIPYAAQKMKFSIKDFFSKSDQILRKLVYTKAFSNSFLISFRCWEPHFYQPGLSANFFQFACWHIRPCYLLNVWFFFRNYFWVACWPTVILLELKLKLKSLEFIAVVDEVGFLDLF